MIVTVVEKEKDVFEINYPLEWYHRFYEDVSHDYMALCFFSSEIVNFGEIVDTIEIKSNDSQNIVHILIKSQNQQSLFDYINLYNIRIGGEDEDEYVEYLDRFEEYQDQILEYQKMSVVPSYCDSFFANYLACCNNWDDEYKTEVNLSHPEWKFWTWKSSWSLTLGSDFYVSSDFWIIMNSSNEIIFSALKLASDYDIAEISFEEISVHYVTNNYILMSYGDKILEIPYWLHLKINECSSQIIHEDEFMINRPKGISGKFYCASNFSCLVYKENSFQYLIFRGTFDILSSSEIDFYIPMFRQIYIDLQKKSSSVIHKIYDWQNLDAEQFEIFIYEVICRDGRFDPKETHKMGKTKSRDGGRDVITKRRWYAGVCSSKHWIAQCKFSWDMNKSLRQKDVILSELIDQYAPEGVIIATNMIIDAGTQDKLQMIGKHRNIPVELWDRFELERLLDAYPDLERKYLFDI